MKKALSLALALVICLGLALPTFAAEEPLTRMEFAKLLVQYAKPDENERGEVPSDCAGLTAEEKDVVAIVIGNDLMIGDADGNFLPNDRMQYNSVVTVLGVKEKDNLIYSPLPEYPEDFSDTAAMAIYDQALDALNKMLSQELGVGVPAWLTIHVDGLYNSGVIKSGTISSLSDPISKATAEEWLKVLYGSGEPEKPADPVEPEKPADPIEKPVEPLKPAAANPTNDQLTVNGELQSPTVYKIDGSNYFKIRDLAAVLDGTEKQFDVGYDGALKSVTATTGKGYDKQDTDLAGAATGGSQAADPSNDTIYIDGQKIDAAVYKINGNNYFKLRDLGKALNFYVGYDKNTGVFIDTSKPYSE